MSSPTPRDWRDASIIVAMAMDSAFGLVAWAYQHVPLLSDYGGNLHFASYVAITIATVECIIIWITKGKGLRP